MTLTDTHTHTEAAWGRQKQKWEGTAKEPSERPSEQETDMIVKTSLILAVSRLAKERAGLPGSLFGEYFWIKYQAPFSSLLLLFY